MPSPSSKIPTFTAVGNADATRMRRSKSTTLTGSHTATIGGFDDRQERIGRQAKPNRSVATLRQRLGVRKGRVPLGDSLFGESAEAQFASNTHEQQHRVVGPTGSSSIGAPIATVSFDGTSYLSVDPALLATQHGTGSVGNDTLKSLQQELSREEQLLSAAVPGASTTTGPGLPPLHPLDRKPQQQHHVGTSSPDDTLTRFPPGYSRVGRRSDRVLSKRSGGMDFLQGTVTTLSDGLGLSPSSGTLLPLTQTAASMMGHQKSLSLDARSSTLPVALRQQQQPQPKSEASPIPLLSGERTMSPSTTLAVSTLSKVGRSMLLDKYIHSHALDVSQEENMKLTLDKRKKHEIVSRTPEPSCSLRTPYGPSALEEVMVGRMVRRLQQGGEGESRDQMFFRVANGTMPTRYRERIAERSFHNRAAFASLEATVGPRKTYEEDEEDGEVLLSEAEQMAAHRKNLQKWKKRPVSEQAPLSRGAFDGIDLCVVKSQQPSSKSVPEYMLTATKARSGLLAGPPAVGATAQIGKASPRSNATATLTEGECSQYDELFSREEMDTLCDIFTHTASAHQKLEGRQQRGQEDKRYRRGSRRR